MSEFDIVKQNGVKFESNCLSLTRRMDLDEAQRFVMGLDSMESGLNFWIGDFILAIESMHGEAAAQIIPEGKAHSWNVYRWTADRVKPATRKANLSWSHHAAVASLLHERQEIFLQKAEAEQLSVSALKKLVKGDGESRGA